MTIYPTEREQEQLEENDMPYAWCKFQDCNQDCPSCRRATDEDSQTNPTASEGGEK